MKLSVRFASLSFGRSDVNDKADQSSASFHWPKRLRVKGLRRLRVSRSPSTQFLTRRIAPGFPNCFSANEAVALRLKMNQKPSVVWFLDPKALYYESLEP